MLFLCCCSVCKSCLTLCSPMDWSTLGSRVLHYPPEFAHTLVHWVSDAIQPSHPLSSLLLLPSIFPSIRVFSNESALCIGWPKYQSFSFTSVLPKNIKDWFPLGLTGVISFRAQGIPLRVQGTLKSLLLHHSRKTSILWRSAFFMVQLSHPSMTAGKTTVLTIQTFVTKVTPLLFNVLSRLVIAFLPRSKHFLNLWLQLWPKRENNLIKSGYMCMYNWFTLLYSKNYHNIVSESYANKN